MFTGHRLNSIFLGTWDGNSSICQGFSNPSDRLRCWDGTSFCMQLENWLERGAWYNWHWIFGTVLIYGFIRIAPHFFLKWVIKHTSLSNKYVYWWFFSTYLFPKSTAYVQWFEIYKFIVTCFLPILINNNVLFSLYLSIITFFCLKSTK